MTKNATDRAVTVIILDEGCELTDLAENARRNLGLEDDEALDVLDLLAEWS